MPASSSFAFQFQSSATEAYCSDKFKISYESESLRLHPDPQEATHSDYLNNATELDPLVQEALSAYTRAFEQYPEDGQLALCFDGGKDGHVVFHLLKTLVNNSPDYRKRLARQPLLIVNIIQDVDDVIPNARALVRNLTEEWAGCLKLKEYINYDIKKALFQIKSDYPKIEAIFMGVRRTDSPWYKNMTVFQKTDTGWPEFMRINPLIDWSYPAVWAYLLNKRIPYCKLYNEGYTSLGRQSNSAQNEHLSVKVIQDEQLVATCYLPAYCLPSAEFERLKR